MAEYIILKAELILPVNPKDARNWFPWLCFVDPDQDPVDPDLSSVQLQQRIILKTTWSITDSNTLKVPLKYKLILSDT